MKFRNKAIRLVAIVAVALTACGGGDSKSSPTTVKVTNPPVTTTLAPPTTVEETTTTKPAPEFQYEIVFVGPVEHNPATGIYTEPIPDDGSYPLGAKNPAWPDALTLSEIMDLDSGSQVCLHGGLDNDQTGVAENLQAEVLDVALSSYIDSATGQVVSFLGIQVNILGGLVRWFDATKFGISPEPDGLTWTTEKYATSGICPAS